MALRARAQRSPLSCPVCGLLLVRQEATYVCDAKHTFDVAREGYVNLILPQHMRTRVPGDNAAMIDARARFLGAGHYAPVAEALVGTIAANLPEARPSVVVDAGCGDGYYLWRLRQSITATSADAYGLDVSRHAIRRAARRDLCSTYVVASNHRLPLQDRSIDVLFSHFSPVDPEEFVRVLAQGGKIILGLPGPEHLFSLKQLIYSTPVPHSLEDPLAACSALALTATRRIQFDLRIESAQHVADLLAMTPFYWSASATIQELLKQRDRLDTTVDVILRTYQPQ